MIESEQVQQTVDQRRPPLGAHHRGAEDDVSERARLALREVVAPVEREGEHVGYLVDPEMLALEPAHLLSPYERDAELTVRDAFGGEHPPGKIRCLRLCDLHPASVLRLDRDHAEPHRLRAVPVSSAWRL